MFPWPWLNVVKLRVETDWNHTVWTECSFNWQNNNKQTWLCIKHDTVTLFSRVPSRSVVKVKNNTAALINTLINTWVRNLKRLLWPLKNKKTNFSFLQQKSQVLLNSSIQINNWSLWRIDPECSPLRTSVLDSFISPGVSCYLQASHCVQKLNKYWSLCEYWLIDLWSLAGFMFCSTSSWNQTVSERLFSIDPCSSWSVWHRSITALVVSPEAPC